MHPSLRHFLLGLTCLLGCLTPTRAENVLLSQDFNACNNPSGWSGLTSSISWDVGSTIPHPAALGSSMNGTCFAYFDDATLGSTPLTNTQSLNSPTFDSSPYATVMLDFDLHFRAPDFANAYLKVDVYTGTAWVQVAIYKGQDYNGDLFSDNVHQSIDLSRYRGSAMRVRFGYNDAGAESWWAGIDNIKVTGRGAINCSAAQAIPVDGSCESATTASGIFNAPAMPACTDSAGAGVWYSFVAPSSAVTVRSAAVFNDVLTAYSGTCGALTEIDCINGDIYGFGSETLYLNGLTTGTTYYLLLSAVQNTFGARSGQYCLNIQNGANIPPLSPPANDWCANPLPLVVGGACLNGDLIDATFDGPIPQGNSRADASVWFTFVSPASGKVAIHTEADFADNIAVYSGSCGAMTEIGANAFGQHLELSGLTGGELYYIQLSGFFSGIEGNYCISIDNLNSATPTNDDCASATLLSVGAADCTPANNQQATYNETIHSSCDLFATASIWFKFNAPTSGKVYINTGADFVHTATLWQGTCAALSEVQCAYNPYRCDDSVLFDGLVSGQTYYLQIASSKMPFGYLYGDVCVRVTNGNIINQRLKLTAYLQGAYDATTNRMTTHLSDNYLLPTSQPYDAAPWNYTGTNCIASNGETGVTDWVLVELRSSSDPNIVIARKAALLYADGMVADYGKNGVDMPNVVIGAAYYVVLRHRNHLAVRSANSIILPNENALDLTQSNAVAGGAAQMALVSSGRYALLSGDFSGNGVISVADYNSYAAQVAAINQYLSADANLDGHITVADFNGYAPNASKIALPEVRY
ncbi:MAG: hypothetical protein IT273_10855 [Chitinophagales bacterium]|nr:hypothetical protein [Chitinophagales bacterium]